MSAQTVRSAAAIWLTSVATMTAVAVLVVATGLADDAQRHLALSFPPRETWHDLAVVLWRNGVLTVSALVFTRHLRSDRVVVWALATAWSLNVTLAGAALAAYPERLLAHAGVYGPVELAAFSTVLATCRRLRQDGSKPAGGELLAIATLLIMAAILETVSPWRP